MIREGRELRSRTEYILGMDHHLFGNVSSWDPMHLYGSGLPPQTTPEGAHQVPRVTQASPPPPTDRPNEGGRNIRVPTEGHPKAAGKGSEEERVNLGGNVETLRLESLRAPRSCKVSGTHWEVGTHHSGNLAGHQAMAGRGGGSGGVSTNGVGPPTQPGSFAPAKGVVQGCS